MMAGTTLPLRVRRSRGALSGVLLVLLGVWGALIPFVGPYFHYAYTPDRTWAVTAGRMWLEVLPGAVALVSGIVVLVSRLRPLAVFAAWLAALAGAWFAVGSVVAAHWTTLPAAGTPVGGSARMALEQIGFFTGQAQRALVSNKLEPAVKTRATIARIRPAQPSRRRPLPDRAGCYRPRYLTIRRHRSMSTVRLRSMTTALTASPSWPILTAIYHRVRRCNC